MKIHNLEKKLLAGIRSPVKLLTESDFDRIRTTTTNKIARFQKRRRREIFVEKQSPNFQAPSGAVYFGELCMMSLLTELLNSAK